MSIDVNLERCCRGDAAAWQTFVIQTAPLIATAIRRVLSRGSAPGRGLDVDDAVQEVFIRLVKDDFRLLASFDPGRASLSTWLTIVARSTTIDLVRRRNLESGSLDDVPPAAIVIDDRPDLSWDDLPTHVLTDRQRLVLQLTFMHGLTVPVAAESLGVNEQTIRSTRHKALERLRAAVFSDENSPKTAGRIGPDDA
ncbi:MAG: sigma-70 family RNA polymerase sigma factor [Planctomycetota bacterium]